MKARLIEIGNSRGVRLPKTMIAEAGLHEDVEIRLQEGAIVILPARPPRSGWSEAAQSLRERDDDLLLDPPTPTRFDDQEWDW